MQIVIDIPEEYREIFNRERCKSKFDSLATNEFGYVLRKAFENGTLQVESEEDCQDCKKWEDCPCGKDGHESGTSQGYSIGECKDFEPQAEREIEK